MGQFSLVQAGLLLILLLAARQPTSPRAAQQLDISWTLSLLWKQNTALLGPLMIRRRRWRALLIAGLTVVLLSAPYFLLHPPDLFRFLAANLVSGPPSQQMGNLGMRQLLYSLSSALIPTDAWPGHLLVQRIWLGLVLVAMLWATWRDRGIDLVEPLCCG